FVNPQPRAVDRLVDQLDRLQFVQCHGDYHAMTDRPAYRLLPAFAVQDAASLEAITRYLDAARGPGQAPHAILVDAHVPGPPGPLAAARRLSARRSALAGWGPDAGHRRGRGARGAALWRRCGQRRGSRARSQGPGPAPPLHRPRPRGRELARRLFRAGWVG